MVATTPTMTSPIGKAANRVQDGSTSTALE